MDNEAAELRHDEAPMLLHIRFVQLDQQTLHIRKWSKDRRFEGAALYINVGNGAPYSPLDSDESYSVDALPSALRHVAECLVSQCEQYVTQECVRIVIAAAQAIEARSDKTGTGLAVGESAARKGAPKGGHPTTADLGLED
jgi:hypothetical protein